MCSSRGQKIRKGTNKWLVRVYLGRVDGKRKYKSKTVTGSENDADQKLTEMLRKKDRGVISSPNSEKLDAFLDEWLEMKESKVAAATARNYRQAISNYIKPGLGHLKLDEVNSRLVQAWVNDLHREHDLAAGTVRLYHTVLRQALQQAVVWEMIPFNPAEGGRVTLPKKEEREYRIFTKSEMRDFLNSTQGDRFHALWALLFATGLRPQEALGLKWSDFDGRTMKVRRVLAVSDVDNREFEIRNEMKTKRSKRDIVIPEFLVPILEAHRAAQARRMMKKGSAYTRNGLVFTNGLGRHADPHTVRRDFNLALEACDLPSEIRLYDTRHTHISHLLMDGIGLKKVSSRAGHSTIKLTADTYGHLDDEAEEEMADAMDQMLAGAAHG